MWVLGLSVAFEKRGNLWGRKPGTWAFWDKRDLMWGCE